MEEDTEYTKLPVEDRCVHKLWKARLHGYEECTKTFQCIDDEKSPEWNKFLGLVKKFVIDSNAAAQEKGLEAVLAFVENAAVAGKTTNDVMSGIITKCIAAPKAKTKDLAVQVTLMYIEIEKHEAVQDELTKGTEAKNPKIVSSCISTLTLALRSFGPKVINIKPLMKKIPAFLEDRDKTVRDETKALVVEIYRWIGAPLKQQLNTLKPLQLSELETEFNSLSNEKPIPTRYLRSQKPKVSCHTDHNSGETGNDDEVDDGDENQVEIDPYELLEPVDILSKLPKDLFYDKIESKKWQERKEALEALETLVKNPKLENGDYGEVIRALKKVISKDSNVVVVALAGKCLTGLATGLKKRFQPYALACLPAILEKFKEKKQNVVTVLRECADAIYLSINIEQILEDVLAALENKNPSVKAETAAFLARSFSMTPPPSLNKKLLKAYTGPLLKTLNEPDPLVRDSSADALGTALKLVGEKAMSPFLVDVDNLKMTKIKESAEKAEIHVKVSTSRKAPSEKSTTVPSKVDSPTRSLENDKTKKPKTGTAGKKPAAKKLAASSVTNLAGTKKSAVKPQTEKNLTNEEVEEMAAEVLPKEVSSGLVDANWKNRLAAVEQLQEHVKQTDASEVSTQLIVRILGKKPGFKDTNFQVLKLKLELIKMLAENYPFSNTVAEYCIMDVTEKLGDPKNSAIAAETLTAIAEATSLEFVANEVMSFAFNQKNPKVQQETIFWLSKALIEFGFTVNTKSLIDNVKKAVIATNPGIRTAAITLCGTMYLFIGKPLLTFFENEKPALKQQIEQECEKFDGEVPPAPIRKLKSNKRSHINEAVDADIEEKTPMTQTDISDMLPRIDISGQITEALLNELADKNWKTRNEALQKIANILTEAKFVKGSLGELPLGLSHRLTDSNSKIAQSTLALCENLATAMGPPIKQYIRVLFPGFLQCLGDSKTWIRTAAISCINTWGEQFGFKEFFDGEMIADALKTGSPTLRNELWIWISEKLPAIPTKQIPKEELLLCLPILYNNLEDRNSDVRKNTQEAVLGYMIHLSYETMLRHTEKLKPGSKIAVIAVLDKIRPNLPVKPLPPSKKSAVDDGGHKTVKSGGAAKAAKAGVKTKGAVSGKSAAARKKDDDVDTSPLLAVNNMKHQRSIDEQKLKILKWNFTTPREEFVDLLKELMSTANVNKTLIANMFHSDFRYHLKAIESLTEDLPDNSKALVCNLDLILKWLTLRFFDTNTSVLLKGLDYLQTVFSFLIEDQYHMLENEAASFIPYLIIKIGDPKDAVRNGVKALFKLIALVYPVSKLFAYVMEGLKSKNARQRTECLDQLGVLIESYGVTVCQPSPAVALKEVAKQIADRDNSVRNAALNCIVQAYFLEGDRVYRLIGQISEKDQSLLDERIKRAAKNRSSKSLSSTKIRASTVQAVVASNDINDVDETNYDDEPEEEQKMEEENDEVKKSMQTPEDNDNQKLESTFVCENKNNYENGKLEEEIYFREKNSKISSLDEMQVKNNNNTNLAVQNTQVKVSGPFGLDMELIQKIESSAPVKCRVPKLLEPNVDLNEPVETLNPTHPRQVIPISPPKLLVPNADNIPPVNPSIGKEDSLERTVLGMASLDLTTAIQSMNTIETFLKSYQATMLQSKEEKFISSVNMQLKLLQTYPLHQGSGTAQVSKGFRTTFMIILTFYDTGILGKNVPLQHLKDLVDQMIGFLAENKLERLNDAEAYIRVINTIVLKIIDNSDHTTIICVLIKLLHERAESNGPAKYEELIMKCLWKIVKTIPNWAGDLDYDTILLEVHNFFKDYPTSWWKKQNKPDTPMRTIKTVLHSMTRVKGSTILSHLTQINNTNESELRSYLMRLITTFKPDDVNTVSKTISKSSSYQGQSQKHVSKFTQQQLSEIFKKIGSKHQAQEGLAQLYDFKLQYPEADVQPFLEKSHQYFQDFIEQGLKDIDKSRKNQNLLSGQTNNLHSTEGSRLGNTNEEGKNMMDPMHRLERLRALEAQCLTINPSQSNKA